MKFLLGGLGESESRSRVRHAFRIADPCADCRATGIGLLRGFDTTGDEFGHAEPLPDASSTGLVFYREEVISRFFIELARGVGITESQMDVAKTLRGTALSRAVPTRKAFSQDTRIRRQRGRVVSLRRISPPKAFEGARFAVRVRKGAIEVPTPRVITDGTRKVALQIPDVPCADQRRRRGDTVVQSFLNSQCEAILFQRFGVLGKRVSNGARTDERRRYYRITRFGIAVARAEATRLSNLVKLARASGFVPRRA